MHISRHEHFVSVGIIHIFLPADIVGYGSLIVLPSVVDGLVVTWVGFTTGLTSSADIESFKNS